MIRILVVTMVLALAMAGCVRKDGGEAFDVCGWLDKTWEEQGATALIPEATEYDRLTQRIEEDGALSGFVTRPVDGLTVADIMDATGDWLLADMMNAADCP